MFSPLEPLTNSTIYHGMKAVVVRGIVVIVNISLARSIIAQYKITTYTDELQNLNLARAGFLKTLH